MSLELALTLLGLLFITVGSIFYFISLLMERYYDRKLWELEQKQKGKIKWAINIVGAKDQVATKDKHKIGSEVLKEIKY